MFKKKKQDDDKFSRPLSPQADRFLAEAMEEYNQKDAAMEQTWRVSSCAEYCLNDKSGRLHVKLQDGTTWEADAQILGSFNPDDQTWQWAWGNPHCAEVWSRDSKIVQETGKQLDIWYLHELPMQPLPETEFVAYFCAIGLKATNSVAVFEADSGSVVLFLLLKNVRWSTLEAFERGAAEGRQGEEQDLTEGIRLIKAGQDEIIPQWNKCFANSEVYVLSLDKDDPSQLMVIGPKGEKNMIAVFTDSALVEKAVAGNENVLFPIRINGRVLVEQARDSKRGLVINPTDESLTIPLPPKMMSVFLEGLDA